MQVQAQKTRASGKNVLPLASSTAKDCVDPTLTLFYEKLNPVNSITNNINTATVPFAFPKPTFKILDNKGSKTGQVRNDSVTDDATPLLSGKGTPGSTITLYNHGKVMATVTVNSKGNWTYAPTLDDGNYSITIAVTDSTHGRSLSPTSSVLNFTVQTKESVFVEKPTFTFNDDNGNEIEAGQETTTRQPYLSGEATVGNTIVVILNGKLYECPVEADENGNGTWELVLQEEDALSIGTHTLIIKALDPDGNPSALETLSFTVAPPSVSIEGLFNNANEPVSVYELAMSDFDSWSSIYADNLPEDGSASTSDYPFIRGTASPGATVTIRVINNQEYVNFGTQTFTTTADPVTGAWSHQLFEGMDIQGKGDLSDVYLVSATATDSAGNPSEPSMLYAFQLDNTPPAIPTVTNATLEGDTGIKLEGGSSWDVRGVSIEVWQGGQLIQTQDGVTTAGSKHTPGQGMSWSYGWRATLPEGLPHGEYVIIVNVTDAAGNLSQSSDNSYSIVVDEQGVHYRPFILAQDQIVLNQSILHADSDEAMLVGKNALFQGKGQTGESVVIVLYDADGNPQHRLKTFVDAQGNWSVSMPDLAEGQWQADIRKVSRDYQSVGEQVIQNFIVDITPPVLLASDLAINGKTLFAEDGTSLISNFRPTLTGKGEAGNTVTIVLTHPDGVQTTRSTTVNSDGDWRVPLQAGTIIQEFPEGKWSMSITAKDAAGNISTPVAQDFFVDRTPPKLSASDITIGTEGQPLYDGTSARPVITDASPTISGKGEPGGTVMLHKFHSSFYSAPYTTVIDADGNWSITVPNDMPLDDGRWNLMIRDAVGNPSPIECGFIVERAPEVIAIEPLSNFDDLAMQTVETAAVAAQEMPQASLNIALEDVLPSAEANLFATSGEADTSGSDTTGSDTTGSDTTGPIEIHFPTVEIFLEHTTTMATSITIGNAVVPCIEPVITNSNLLPTLEETVIS